MYEIERQFGKGSHLYWMRMVGGVKGRRTGAPGEDDDLVVGVILRDDKILRTITAIVDADTMSAIDSAILDGSLALPAQGSILDSSALIMKTPAESVAESGAR